MSLTITAPVTGEFLALEQLADPVFSAGMVGPGTAIEPDATEPVAVHAPVSGAVVKLHPHAFVVQVDDNRAVLVHVGIDTVNLKGSGFRVHVSEGDRVREGQLLVEMQPQVVADAGYARTVIVVALEASPDAVQPQGSGRVTAGQPLLSWS